MVDHRTAFALALALAGMVPRVDPFAWEMVGESQHWVVILHGSGQRGQGRVTDAEVRPWVIWTGGGAVPRKYTLQLSVEGIRCGPMTVTRSEPRPPDSPKLDILGVCKLAPPGGLAIPGENPQDFTVSLAWDGQTERVGWRFGFPAPAPQEKQKRLPE